MVGNYPTRILFRVSSSDGPVASLEYTTSQRGDGGYCPRVFPVYHTAELRSFVFYTLPSRAGSVLPDAASTTYFLRK